MFVEAQYRVLRRFFPGSTRPNDETTYDSKSKLATLLGEQFFDAIRDKVVLDFGCGEGAEAVEMASKGARQVFGLDIRNDVLNTAREKAATAGVDGRCLFGTSFGDLLADAIVSLDAFEHFDDPGAVLRQMDSLLKPDGEVFVSFGRPWYHPLGGHGFSVFPWSHLIFSETAQLRWRSDFKSDGATRFHEVAGGLNQMTIRRFEDLVAASAFRFASLEPVPIRKLRRFHNRMTREFTTAVVRCRLIKKRPAER